MSLWVGTMRLLTAAELVDVAEEGGDDINLPPSTDRQDPLQVCDSGHHGNLVSHDDLTHHVVFVVRQLGDVSRTYLFYISNMTQKKNIQSKFISPNKG
jgi:hypothetical protein